MGQNSVFLHTECMTLEKQKGVHLGIFSVLLLLLSVFLIIIFLNIIMGLDFSFLYELLFHTTLGLEIERDQYLMLNIHSPLKFGLFPFSFPPPPALPFPLVPQSIPFGVQSL